MASASLSGRLRRRVRAVTVELVSIAPDGTALLTVLGAGSVFDVALVRDSEHRELILKRVRAGFDASSGSQALAREANILAACATPHLPRLVRLGVDEAGGYLLETRAPGQALRDRVPRPAAVTDGLAWAAVAASTSAALASLHGLADQRGRLDITHGDLSPDNIFYWPTSPTTFVDLSSATWREAPSSVSPQHRGTLPYAAPELARNEAPASQASDTYALAAVLLTLAVGPICDADTAASRLLEIGTRGVLRQKIDERADLPRAARRAIVDALAFDARARNGSSAELAKALAGAVSAPV